MAFALREQARLLLVRLPADGTNDAAGFTSCCGLASCSAPLRTRPLDHARGLHYRGPWRLPRPDSHRLAALSLSLGYVITTSLVVTAPKQLDALPELPASWPQLAVQHLQVGRDSLGLSVGRTATGYQVGISGATGMALTAGVVLPPGGSNVASVTLNGRRVPYRMVTTNRGQQVEVSVPAPHGPEQLVVTLG